MIEVEIVNLCDSSFLPTSGIYLHGLLERDKGYDIVYARNCDVYLRNNTENCVMIPNIRKMAAFSEGIYPIKVVGVEKSCTAYVWKNSLKGLIRVENIFDGYKGVYCAYDEQTEEQEQTGCLETVFKDGQLLKDYTLSEIRNNINQTL